MESGLFDGLIGLIISLEKAGLVHFWMAKYKPHQPYQPNQAHPSVFFQKPETLANLCCFTAL